MAYDRDNWSRQTDAMNTGGTAGLAIFSYRTGADNGAAVSGANYFANAVRDLDVGDLVFAEASDGFLSLQVAALDKDAGTITTSSTGLTAAVGTANIEDDAVTSDKLAANMLKYVQVAVTSAQVLAMSATPVQLVAAAGANTAVLVEDVLLQYNFASAAYAAGGSIGVQYGNTALLAGQVASDELAGATFNAYVADTVHQLSLTNTGITTTLAGSTNLGLFLSNDTAAFTTGDGDLLLNVWYKVVPTV